VRWKTKERGCREGRGERSAQAVFFKWKGGSGDCAKAEGSKLAENGRLLKGGGTEKLIDASNWAQRFSFRSRKMTMESHDGAESTGREGWELGR